MSLRNFMSKLIDNQISTNLKISNLIFDRDNNFVDTFYDSN